jgi:hypothetical protein
MNRILSLLWFFTLITSCSLEKECEEEVRRKYTNQEFSGIVKEAYFQVSNGGRGAPKIILSDSTIHPVHSDILICSANQGDSIIKRKGTLRYLLKSEGTTTVFYPECKRKLILDSNKTAFNSYGEIRCGKDK